MKGDYNLTPEQEEMRTRGLRILARWIASVYLRDRALAAKADAEGVTGGHATQEGQDRTLPLAAHGPAQHVPERARPLPRAVAGVSVPADYGKRSPSPKTRRRMLRAFDGKFSDLFVVVRDDE